MRPRLLDLFSGAGGAAMGYHRAGFEVVGVDVKPQPHYPFEFHQADAMTFPLDGFDGIHGSPVCKRHSAATPTWARAAHPNQIAPLRERLSAQPTPWVIENVPGAPLRPDIKLCGCVTGLHELKRERWFELGGWQTFDLRAPCYHAASPITVAGHGEPSGPRMAKKLIAHKADWERAMGIDWMNRDELAQAIPPAYTEYIGARLFKHLRGES
jgi:DNA (cytosine-5)-methyltransferase 1